MFLSALILILSHAPAKINIQNEGVNKGQYGYLNFEGATVDCVPTNNGKIMTCTLTGGTSNSDGGVQPDPPFWWASETIAPMRRGCVQHYFKASNANAGSFHGFGNGSGPIVNSAGVLSGQASLADNAGGSARASTYYLFTTSHANGNYTSIYQQTAMDMGQAWEIHWGQQFGQPTIGGVPSGTAGRWWAGIGTNTAATFGADTISDVDAAYFYINTDTSPTWKGCARSNGGAQNCCDLGSIMLFTPYYHGFHIAKRVVGGSYVAIFTISYPDGSSVSCTNTTYPTGNYGYFQASVDNAVTADFANFTIYIEGLAVCH